MIATFESILPVFLLMLAGNLLRRTPLTDAAGWRGLEQLGYFVFYPSLLFVTILNADFSGIEVNAMLASLLGCVAVMAALTYALWPLLDGFGLVAHTEFSSVFQTAIRWNGFIALALAQKFFPPAGMAVVALAMAVIIIPINLASIYVVTRFAQGEVNWRRIAFNIVTNPLIIPCVIAALMRMTPYQLYAPLNDTFKLLGSAALGMGLLSIGAGLRPMDLVRVRMAMVVPVVLKLIVFPSVMFAIALGLGISGQPLLWLALCAAVPTALNGYLLARQLGGDAELYAAVATLQTIVSFFTIPLVLAVGAQLAAG